MGEREEVRQRDIFSSPPGRERDTERERERMREKEREREQTSRDVLGGQNVRPNVTERNRKKVS